MGNPISITHWRHTGGSWKPLVIAIVVLSILCAAECGIIIWQNAGRQLCESDVRTARAEATKAKIALDESASNLLNCQSDINFLKAMNHRLDDDFIKAFDAAMALENDFDALMALRELAPYVSVPNMPEPERAKIFATKLDELIRRLTDGRRGN